MSDYSTINEVLVELCDDYIVNCVNCHDGLLEALKQITQHYCQLIESGDCGFWDPETDSCVIKARYYISQSEGKPQ